LHDIALAVVRKRAYFIVLAYNEMNSLTTLEFCAKTVYFLDRVIRSFRHF